jgi:hypothetical protein
VSSFGRKWEARREVRSEEKLMSGSLLDWVDEIDELQEESGPVGSSCGSSVALGEAQVRPGQGELAPVAPVAPVAQLLQKPIQGIEEIKDLFLAAKGSAEVYAYAADCSMPVWLDWMVKLSPKQMKVSGQLDHRAVFASLGPVKRK